ncbi:hypothetical protein SLH49_11230 [Cognatiyoonia sp. IB215446]|uniref:hypothetical protein n=1 Tax=Cognatiyoonia sp. IB215446 TaxID=3097355 RepID=UPI002A1653D2|nr:hypothetical protein [Cognatiyoonia sp. IB215446]MDX8348560.1 hypothetical protein [Cognatiyoonia sp. IB215446]
MPYEPVTMGLKFQNRVRDLTSRDVLVVTCPVCHAKFNVAPHHLFARYHEYQKLMDIERDFKCRRCGQEDDFFWHIMRAVGPQFPASA